METMPGQKDAHILGTGFRAKHPGMKNPQTRNVDTLATNIVMEHQHPVYVYTNGTRLSIDIDGATMPASPLDPYPTPHRHYAYRNEDASQIFVTVSAGHTHELPVPAINAVLEGPQIRSTDTRSLLMTLPTKEEIETQINQRNIPMTTTPNSQTSTVDPKVLERLDNLEKENKELRGLQGASKTVRAYFETIEGEDTKARFLELPLDEKEKEAEARTADPNPLVQNMEMVKINERMAALEKENAEFRSERLSEEAEKYGIEPETLEGIRKIKDPEKREAELKKFEARAKTIKESQTRKSIETNPDIDTSSGEAGLSRKEAQEEYKAEKQRIKDDAAAKGIRMSNDEIVKQIRLNKPLLYQQAM